MLEQRPVSAASSSVVAWSARAVAYLRIPLVGRACVFRRILLSALPEPPLREEGWGAPRVERRKVALVAGCHVREGSRRRASDRTSFRRRCSGSVG